MGYDYGALAHVSVRCYCVMITQILVMVVWIPVGAVKSSDVRKWKGSEDDLISW